ncbi:MAG TPA: methenyltetrahydromethanopterin cyclohydrolase [Candidatus Limnocylindrales bacterium]|nr:methenyltetrahydromethanopterin cyclohydrolase [Candidatus Limnocylindrales bacterium]
MPKISLNKSALNLVNKLCNESDKYQVNVEKSDSGATLIDAGIEAEGGFLAGEMVTEICLAGYGTANAMPIQYGNVILPSVFIKTDYPALSTLASQFAGWQVKGDGFSAIASGPARALALKPKDLYEKLQFKEESDSAVLVLETQKKPSEAIIQLIADKCRVSTKSLYLVMFSTTSLAGATQVSGRIVETGLHKLERLGLDPLVVKHAWGYAPIVPIHPDSGEAMGRTNDAILYGGVTSYTVSYEDEQKLQNIVKQAPSSASAMMQEARRLANKNPRFLDIFKEAGFDFYKIDTNLFAPAVVSINNTKTGKTFTAGNIDPDVIKGSLGLT